MIRLLTFTNLYPNPAQPRHGIFVEHRLKRLVGTGAVEAYVIAPVPWCPLPLDKQYPEYRVRDIPEVDERNGITIYHPRYWVIPGLTSALNPWSMMRAAMPVVRKLLAQGHDFDIVDAQFLYPDGIAGVMIGRKLGKRVTLTARGSDVNVALRESVPLRWFTWAKRHVSAFITVSAALKIALVEAGAPAEQIEVIRNGVDLELFQERDRDSTRAALGLQGTVLVSVGNLVEGKGHHLVIDALSGLLDCSLIVIGKGPEAERLREQSMAAGLQNRIRFIPHVDQAQLAQYYSAADITILASSREGMPNVVLESMACGTAVVATSVGGTAEVMSDPAAGILITKRSAADIATAVRQLAGRLSRTATREHARQFGWQDPIAQQLRLLERLVGDAGHSTHNRSNAQAA
jgi:glycosyltransferase involved in cell wall biosynthesis